MSRKNPLTRSRKKTALALLDQNRHAEAMRVLEQIVRLDRTDAGAWLCLGIVRARLGDLDQAQRCVERALRLRPNYEEGLLWHGIVLTYQNRLADAAGSFRQVLALNARHPEAWKRLGRSYEALENHGAAGDSFRRAVALAPRDDEAYADLGQYLYGRGEYDKALAAFARALEIAPDNLKAALGYHLAIPIIYRDHAHLVAARRRYEQGLQRLTADAPRFRGHASLINDLLWSNGFYLAYQGLDDRELQVRFGAFFRSMAASALPQFMTAPPRRPATGKRIRIGYACHYLHEHTVSYYFRNWIEHADRDGFEIFVYHIDPHMDTVSQAIASESKHYRPITGSLTNMARTIRDDALDILVFLEVGMHPRHLWLAALRLAPIQCAAWGHPVTTGLDSIDYYLSADATEPDDAQSHYSEILVRLPGMGVSCPTPAPPPQRHRADFGLPEDRTLYLCAQSVFKIHVDTDALLAGVAKRVPDALIVLFADGRPAVDTAFLARVRSTFAARGLDPERHLHVMPRLGSAEYRALNAVADVMLDTPHWSGGRTSFDALGAGLPVITLPGAYSRGRQTYGMLRVLGLEELIAADAENYIERATIVGRDRALRMHLSDTIRARRHRLFADPRPIRALQAFYRDAVRGG